MPRNPTMGETYRSKQKNIIAIEQEVASTSILYHTLNTNSKLRS